MATPVEFNLKTSRKEIVALKQPFVLNKTQKNGLLIQIHHTVREQNSSEKHHRFTHASFNESGEWLAIIDHPGNIFIFDLASELFWELPKVGMCSLITFNAFKTDEVFVGRSDGDIYLINSESGGISGCLKGHTEPLRQVSFAHGLPYCLTSTYEKAIIWDLRSNSQLHHLNLRTKVSIKMVMFMPATNNILGCFKNDTIHIWKFETFDCLKQIFPDMSKIHKVKSIAFTRNGRAMVVTSETGKMAVISLDTGIVQKVITLPEICSGVKHIEFLPQLFDGGANKILAVLSSISVYMIDIETSVLLNTIVHPQGRISSLVCSPHGKYMACILQSGEVNIYSTVNLLAGEEQKPTVSKSKLKPRKLDKHQHQKQLTRIHAQINQILDLGRLLPLLKQYGEYPEHYRPLIWKTILQLPGNQTAYVTLVNKGIHPKYHSLDQTYPLKNKSLLKSLKRLLSCLSHWSPLFSQVMYLPVFVFPFLKVFKYDQLVCYEVVASIIVNWCQYWFEYFPFPPINVLTMIENVLTEHDPELAAHLTECKISSQIYAWPLLETAFSEVLSRKDWLQFWDHVLSNHPTYLLMAVAAFNISARTSLISIEQKEDFENFYRKETLNIKLLIKKTYRLMSNTSVEYHPSQYIKPYQSLMKGCTYQEFTQYPKNMLDNQIDKLNDMRKEEIQLIQEQKEILRKKIEQEAEKQEQRQARINEIRLMELEDVYKNVLKDEETRIADHRRKITDLRHELKKQEYHLIEHAKNKMLNHKTNERKVQLEGLLTDIDHKRKQDKLEIEALEQETRSYYLELLKKKKKLEMELQIEELSPDPQYLGLKRQQKILSEQLKKLRNEASRGYHHKEMELTTYIAMVDNLLQKVELKLARDMAERHSNLESGKQSIEVFQLEAQTKALEQEVKLLLEELISHRENKLSMKTSKLQLRENHVHCKNIPSISNTHYLSENDYSGNYDPVNAAMDIRRKIIMKQKNRSQHY